MDEDAPAVPGRRRAADRGRHVAKGINEVMFPVGCALVLYASGAMAKRL